MRHLSFLIKPASSACNMKCSYCFYTDVAQRRSVPCHSIMQEETICAILKKSLQYYKEPCTISYCFQGGEPLLAGKEFYKRFFSNLKKYNIYHHCTHSSLQTNGYAIDEEWCTIFREHDMLVGVSLDAFQSNHDAVRHSLNGKATHHTIVKHVNLLRAFQVRYNVVTVLTKQLAQFPQETYAFYQKEQIENIQLIPCLRSLDYHEDDFSVSPKEFASFYKLFYASWLKELNHGHYRSVTLFENIIPMYQGIAPQQCGMLGTCLPQFVIEANGDVYPCDFYVLDEYKIGNILKDSIKHLIKSVLQSSFKIKKGSSCACCLDCKYMKICHGNCKRMKYAYYDDVYCGYQEFLAYSEYSMREISKRFFPQ